MAPKTRQNRRQKTQKETQEIRKKMKRECERKRRARVKNHPEQRELNRHKEHERYLRRKSQGKIELIGDRTKRDQRAQKKKWRENSKKYYEKKKEVIKVKMEESKQVKAGRKRKRRENRAVNAKVQELLRGNQSLQRKVEKWKKRYQRLRQGGTNRTVSPRTAVRKAVRRRHVPSDIRQRLVFGEALKHQLSTSFNSLTDERSRSRFSSLVSGKIMKKYRLLGKCSSFLSYKRFHSNLQRKDCAGQSVYGKSEKTARKSAAIRTAVCDFFESDDNSRLGAGKKECITRKGEKKQKRYLNFSMKELHVKFKSTVQCNIHYSFFVKLKPFWVLIPKHSDRDTCLCVTHANTELLVARLHSLQVIDHKTPNELMSSLCCDVQSVPCLLRHCDECKERIIVYSDLDMTSQTSVFKWESFSEDRVISGTVKSVKVTKKKEIFTSIGCLIDECEKTFPLFMQHFAYILHQYRAISELKSNLLDNEALLHIDFSENYGCKYATEVQGVHFGASRLQLSIHTGMQYQKHCKSAFLTVSDCLRHDAPAILAHLTPVLRKLLQNNPSIDRLHFLSDGPTTQYRNRTMFAMVPRYIPSQFPQIKEIVWNFSEAGHGKGAPDGVGATLKRCADSAVARGGDIDSLEKFIRVNSEKVEHVDLMTVSADDVLTVESQILPKIAPFPGTMQVHQWKWTNNDKNVYFSKLSCYSCATGVCTHYSVGSPWNLEMNSSAAREPSTRKKAKAPSPVKPVKKRAKKR